MARWFTRMRRRRALPVVPLAERITTARGWLTALQGLGATASAIADARAELDHLLDQVPTHHQVNKHY